MKMPTSIPASFDRFRPSFGGGGQGKACRFSTSLETKGQTGFTLIELMVVLTIIGFISAAVVLAIPDPRGRMIEDADRFAARLAAARDEAVVTARPMGVWISASGYGFQRRAGRQWVGREDKPSAKIREASGVASGC